VLPKGKLYPGEGALAGAKREVLEETGHEVSVHGCSWLDAFYSVDGPDQDRTVLAYAGQRWSCARADGRHQGCEVALLETSNRNALARSRKAVPRQCRSGRAQGDEAIFCAANPAIRGFTMTAKRRAYGAQDCRNRTLTMTGQCSPVIRAQRGPAFPSAACPSRVLAWPPLAASRLGVYRPTDTVAQPPAAPRSRPKTFGLTERIDAATETPASM